MFPVQLGDSHHRGSRVVLGILGLSWLAALVANRWSALHFTLQPGLLFSNYYFWTLLSFSFFDASLVSGALNIFFCAALSPPYERIVGAPFLFRFLGLMSVLLSLSLYFSSIMCWWLEAVESCIFIELGGFTGCIAALSVGWKQKFPERSLVDGIQKSPKFLTEALKWKFIPSYLILLSFLLPFFPFIEAFHARALFLGVIYSWIYLRFFAVDSVNGGVGDLRSEFSFATFAPDIPQVRGVLNFIGAVVFKMALSLGLFHEAVKSFEVQQQQQQQSQALLQSVAIAVGHNSTPFAVSTLPSASSGMFAASLAGALPSSSALLSALASDPVAERRRQLAMKAIDDKLAELSRGGLSSSAVLDPELPDTPFHHSNTSSINSNGSNAFLNASSANPTNNDFENVSVDDLDAHLKSLQIPESRPI